MSAHSRENSTGGFASGSHWPWFRKPRPVFLCLMILAGPVLAADDAGYEEFKYQQTVASIREKLDRLLNSPGSEGETDRGRFPKDMDSNHEQSGESGTPPEIDPSITPSPPTLLWSMAADLPASALTENQGPSRITAPAPSSRRVYRDAPRASSTGVEGAILGQSVLPIDLFGSESTAGEGPSLSAPEPKSPHPPRPDRPSAVGTRSSPLDFKIEVPQLVKAPSEYPPAESETADTNGADVPPIQSLLDVPLKPFGYDFFTQVGQQTAPTLPEVFDAPVDYRLGPGDGLSVHAFSKVIDEVYQVDVNSQGRIQIPRVGELYVSGIPYGDFNDFLINQLSKELKEVQVSSSFSRLRSFTVMVTGEVKTPGLVVVNALTTPLAALIQAGGSTRRGSLRSIRVLHADGSQNKIDLYGLLQYATPDSSIRLNAGDVISVPVVGTTAAIYGMVRRPAIYELMEAETLANLIDYAGGFSPGAYRRLIQIIRTNASGQRVRQDVSLSPPGKVKASSIKMRDGDVCRIPELSLDVTNTVKVEGNIKRPGEYQWRPGLRVSDLINQADGLKPRSFMGRAEVIGLPSPLGSRAGPYPYRTGSKQKVISINLHEAMRGNPEHDVVLNPLDFLKVFRSDEVWPQGSVSVFGDVVRPGDYPLAENMRLSDLIFRAGGLISAARPPRAELSRQRPNGEIEATPLDLADVLRGDKKVDIHLANGDSLTVFSDPIRSRRIRVVVVGQVQRPGTYTMHRGQRISDLVSRSGGFLQDAFLYGTVFDRISVRDRKTKERNSFVSQQRLQILKVRQGDSTESESLSQDSVAALNEADRLLELLVRAEVSGRVVIRLDPYENFVGGPDDKILEDGDTLTIPSPPGDVVVVGQVFSPGAFGYEKNRKVSDYLRMAGGHTRLANRGESFVVRADGSGVSARSLAQNSWNGVQIQSTSVSNFSDTPIMPGDKIIVPFDDRPKTDRNLRNLDVLVKSLSSLTFAFSLLNQVN